MRVAQSVVHQLLHGAKDGDFDIRGHGKFTLGCQMRRQTVFAFKGLHVPFECGHQTQIVQHHRAQIKNKIADALKGGVGGGFQITQLGAGAGLIGIEQALDDFGLQDQIRERLRGPIVHLAGEVLAFDFLRFDDLNDGLLIHAGCALAANKHGGRRFGELPPDGANAIQLSTVSLQDALFILQLLQLVPHHKQAHLRVVDAGVGVFDFLAWVRIEIGFQLSNARSHIGLPLLEFINFPVGLLDEDFDFARFVFDLRALFFRIFRHLQGIGYDWGWHFTSPKSAGAVPPENIQLNLARVL